MNYSELRKRTRKVTLGRDGTEKIYVGGDSPVSVQSMLNVPTDDFDAVLKQTRELEKASDLRYPGLRMRRCSHFFASPASECRL